jgi:phage protein D
VLRNSDNALLDSALLDLGKTVEIHLGYGSDLSPALLGEIAAIEPSFPQDGAPTITVSGYDKSYKMRRTQPEPTDYK